MKRALVCRVARVATAVLFLGGAATAAVPDFILTSPDTDGGNNFGLSVANSGDVNGDGADDLLVGATIDGNGEGRTYLFSGSDGSILRTVEPPSPKNTERFGLCGTINDVTGDGVRDHLISAYGDPVIYLFSGADGALVRTMLPPTSSVNIGSFLALEDVNGDSVPDFAMNCTRFNVHFVSVYSTADGTEIYRITTGEHDQLYAWDVIEDLDSDSIPDLVATVVGERLLYLFSGADGSTIRTVGHPDGWSDALFPRCAVTIPDWNGDSVSDILVGAPGDTVGEVEKAGVLYVLSGADGTMLQRLENPIATYRDEMGLLIVSLENFLGDGRDFVAVQHDRLIDYSSAVVVLYSLPDFSVHTIIRSPVQTVSGLYPHLTKVDVNGDGCDDLLISRYDSWDEFTLYVFSEKGPKLDVTPTSLDFGNRNPADGASTAKELDLANVGFTELTFTGVKFEITGADAADFSLGGQTSAVTVAHDTSIVLTVEFNPSSLGSKSASLVITSDAANGTSVTVPLSGTGTESILIPDYAIYMPHPDGLMMIDPVNGNRRMVADASNGAGNDLSGLHALAELDAGHLIGIKHDGIYRIDRTNGDRQRLIELMEPQLKIIHEPGQIAVIDPHTVLFRSFIQDPREDGLFAGNLTDGTHTAFSTNLKGSGDLYQIPSALALVPSGDVYVGDYGAGLIIHVDAATGNRANLATESSFSLTYCEQDGMLYSCRPSKRITRIDPDTGTATIIMSDTIGTGPQVGIPRGLTVSHDGSLLVVDLEYNSLLRVNRVSGDRTVISSSSTANPVGTGPDLIPAYDAYWSRYSLVESGLAPAATAESGWLFYE